MRELAKALCQTNDTGSIPAVVTAFLVKMRNCFSRIDTKEAEFNGRFKKSIANVRGGGAGQVSFPVYQEEPEILQMQDSGCQPEYYVCEAPRG